MKFSLVNLLLIVTAAAALAGLYGSWRSNSLAAAKYESSIAEYQIKVAELQQQLKKIRQENGLLTIEEPEKINAIKVRVDTERTWQYRVHLPAGQNYFFGVKINSLPSDPGKPPAVSNPPGKSTISTLDRNSSGIAVEPGEHVVTLTVFQLDSDWRYRLNVRPAGEAGDGKTSGSAIQHDEKEWPLSSDWTAESGVTNQQLFPPEENCVLLDFRSMPEGVNDSSKSDQGVMLWVGTSN